MHDIEKNFRENLKQTERRIQKTICPIYGIDNNDQPYLVGSSIPFRIQSRSFLVTAAHVLDEHQWTTLYTGGDEELVQLAGSSHRIQRPTAGRHVDNFDFGFIEISSSNSNQWSRYTFLTTSDLDAEDVPDGHTLYAFVGFPETRNRALRGHKFRLSAAIFVLLSCSFERYGSLGLNPGTHFLGEFDREKQIDSERKVVTGPDPRGISGGGVWRLGRASEFASPSNSEKLIGIGIEYRRAEKVLVGVRISLVLAALAATCPELAKELPQSRRFRADISISTENGL